MTWQQEWAEPWAATVLAALGTPFPYKSGHMSLGPDDCDVTPWTLHPSFHGSLDWHSSCHMQWSAVTLLEQSGDQLSADTRGSLTAVLDERLTIAKARVEADYLRQDPGFERPYGWGWVAMLADATRRSSQPSAAAWARAAGLVADAAFENLVAWLPRLVRPVRTGQHDNTAFGLTLCREAAGRLGRDDVVTAVDAATRRLFLADVDYPSRYEPSGNDFLSAALCQAQLVHRVLPPGEREQWLARFLPGLGEPGDVLLQVPEVADRTDGKLVHLFGLALSRAWQLRELAPSLDPERGGSVRRAADEQEAWALAEVVSGHFMSTHWLVTFALAAQGAGFERG